MASKKLGALIKEARTNAGLSQEALAKIVGTISASDISKAERGDKELPQAALKAIAKATGVTQKSLLEAAAGTSSAKTSSSTKKSSTSKDDKEKTSSSKTSSAKTSSSKTSTSSKKSGTTTSGTKKSSGTKVELTATEKKVIELYRAADSETKKTVTAILKGEKTGSEDLLNNILGMVGGEGALGSLLGGLTK